MTKEERRAFILKSVADEVGPDQAPAAQAIVEELFAFFDNIETLAKNS